MSLEYLPSGRGLICMNRDRENWRYDTLELYHIRVPELIKSRFCGSVLLPSGKIIDYTINIHIYLLYQ